MCEQKTVLVPYQIRHVKGGGTKSAHIPIESTSRIFEIILLESLWQKKGFLVVQFLKTVMKT